MSPAQDEILQRADYVIVGAGSAGCVLANRLSENPDTSVVLIEAGGRDNSPNIKLPVGYARTMGDPKFDWCFSMGPEPGIGGRTIAYTRGKVLGGCSSINGLAYVRGSRHDYDRWAEAGCTGWDWQSLLPYFKRSESYIGASSGEDRGNDGPLKVTMNNWHPLSQRLVDASVEAGLPVTHDYNIAAPLGLARAQLNLWKSKRFSAADAYLVPARKRKNLHIITHASAEHVDTVDGIATGVAVSVLGQTSIIKATREVILCGGAIGSPTLLERSGIGQADRLTNLGIKVVRNSPEVGENLQDHYLVTTRRELHGVTSFNEESRGARVVINALRYLLFRTGFLSGTPTEVVGYGRVADGTGPADIEILGAPMSYAVSNDTDGNPYVTVDKHPGVSLSFYQCRPESRGHVHLKSKSDPSALSLVANFMSSAQDQEIIIRGMRLCQKILTQSQFDKIGGKNITPTVDMDDRALLDFAKQSGTTAYHIVGSCRMGRDENAVVDTSLKVRGISRLRVADASIMPLLVGANTHAATIMIGEYAADLILNGQA